jgi:uncharacterized protein (DUF58 family)
MGPRRSARIHARRSKGNSNSNSGCTADGIGIGYCNSKSNSSGNWNGTNFSVGKSVGGDGFREGDIDDGKVARHCASAIGSALRALACCGGLVGAVFWRSNFGRGSMTPSDLISPALRARLRDLRLLPRQAAAGQGLGLHSSRSRGVGLEFAQYRAYAPGDEPRRVDWKLFARSDRYFVRESERDSPLELWLLVDATASMAQADAAHPGHSRLDAARTLAACCIELALRQGDHFGLAALSDQATSFVPRGSGPRQRDRCLQEMLRWRAQGAWPSAAQSLPLWERVAPASLVIVLSDGFDEAAIALAERLAAARRDVVLIQILTAEERDFPFRGSRRFVDPESAEEVLADPAMARAEYLQAFAAARQALRARLTASGIRLATHFLDQPADAALRTLFGARAGGEAAWD